MKNDAGELSLSDKQKLQAWVQHYNRLHNVEFDWRSDSLPEVAPIAGPSPPVTSALISKALKKRNFGKPLDLRVWLLKCY